MIMEETMKGKQFTLPKGTMVYSTDPSFTPDGKPLKRSQTITAFDADPNCDSEGRFTGTLRVLWTGTGGYWKWANIKSEIIK